jgi:hypothetical protein
VKPVLHLGRVSLYPRNFRRYRGHRAEELIWPMRMIIENAPDYERCGVRNSRSGNFIRLSPWIEASCRRNEISRSSGDRGGDLAWHAYLQYQPIIDIAAGMICGWSFSQTHNATYGLISPMELYHKRKTTCRSLGKRFTVRAFNSLIIESGPVTNHSGIDYISTIQLLNEEFQDTFIDLIKDMNLNPRISASKSPSRYSPWKSKRKTALSIRSRPRNKVPDRHFGTVIPHCPYQRLDIDCI